MPPSHLGPSAKPPSGRYLSFAEREEIALLRVQGHGVREIARRSVPTAAISKIRVEIDPYSNSDRLELA